MTTQFTYFFADAKDDNGKPQCRIIFNENGGYADSLPVLQSSSGVRKVAPSAAESKRIKKENTIKTQITDAVIESWTTKGEIPTALKKQYLELAL